MSYKVREIKEADIELISNYWLQSSPDFLLAMGVDRDKLPTREKFEQILQEQIHSDYKRKRSYALIWEVFGETIGHCNLDRIEFGNTAKMHLHLWQAQNRQKGIGTSLVKLSLPYFFEHFKLEEIICEPYAHNPAPNKTLQKLGFLLVKKHTTIPGYLNFEQEVNRWRLSRKQFKLLYL